MCFLAMSALFLVVETLSVAREREVSAVPDLWVTIKDGKTILHWPPGKDASLKARKRMAPTDKWTFYPCKVLKDNIGNVTIFQSKHIRTQYIFSVGSYEEARQQCDIYADYTDSDAADNAVQEKNYYRKHPLKKIQYYEVIPNFNESFSQAGSCTFLTFIIKFSFGKTNYYLLCKPNSPFYTKFILCKPNSPFCICNLNSSFGYSNSYFCNSIKITK